MSYPDHNLSECRIVRDFEELLTQNQLFSCFYVDAPWDFRNRSSRGAAINHYGTLCSEEIERLPISKIAAPNAHLHLWAPNALLPDCLKVIKAWGFEYKTNFAWVKPRMGLGNYWRSSHELLLLGVRGRLSFKVKDKRSWFEAPRTDHSTKPDSIRELVEQVSPGPYLELFGRRTTPGWTVFGDQVEQMLF
ncbi:MAG: MT-A70 family methyltransferase [Pseudomonadota bacterium]